MSSTPSSEENAARIGAVSTRTAAVIGALAVTVSAVCSVVAANISADKTAKAMLENTAIQMEGETERSRADFLRTERQELYGSFLTATQDAQLSMPNPDLQPVDEDYEASLKKLWLLSSLAGEIRIVGSRETADAAENVLEEFAGFVASEVLRPLCEKHSKSIGGDCVQDVADLPSGSRGGLKDATDAFAEQARVDLEVD